MTSIVRQSSRHRYQLSIYSGYRIEGSPRASGPISRTCVPTTVEVNALVEQFLATSESLSKAFVIAVLLTGRVTLGESAVMEGIELLTPGGALEELVVHTAVAASLGPNRGPDEPDAQSFTLPVEMQRVMRLPRHLRHSFVLRVLAGMTREQCAKLLNLDPSEVDQAICMAARALVVIAHQDTSRLRASNG